MIFKETTIKGVYTIDLERRADERGYFARTYCREEFARRGIACDIVQSSISCNPKRGTFRGMHYQRKPYAEKKLVSCMQGAVYDVVVDLRPDSPTHRRWLAVVLSLSDFAFSSHVSPLTSHASGIFIPEGCAHGFQTLTDDALVLYQMSEFYHPESAAGVRWDDPAFGIRWPFPPAVVSEKDRSYEFVIPADSKREPI